MFKQDGKDPLQAAMEEAAGSDALDFSRIDWQTLHNNLSFDISITRAAHDVADRKLQLKRDERRDKIRRIIGEARKLYEEDLNDDRGIARRSSRPVPETLGVLSDLERAAKGALDPVKDPPKVGNAGERIVRALTEQTFLNTVTSRMAKRFKKHFKLDADYSKSRVRNPKCDGPFLRMARFALREYGEKEYELSSIARALDETRAKSPRARAKKKQNSVPAPCNN